MQEMTLVAHKNRRGRTFRYELIVTAKVSLTPDQLLSCPATRRKLQKNAGIRLEPISPRVWDDVLRSLLKELVDIVIEGDEVA